MTEGMMPPPNLNVRNITQQWTNNYGQTKTELDLGQLQGFTQDVSSSVNTLVEHANYFHRVLNDLKQVQDFVNWIDQIHPELRRDYVTSKRVAMRLEPDEGAVAVEEKAG
jgi:hypothetical protein